ncbi:prolyl oligopeptidase family serine peptidase [bacterium]|nr:prolyl oligopeptidase family serine peptidase [bacterium]
MPRFVAALSLAVVVLSAPCLADGPQDNQAQNVRPVPPVGLELSGADRMELETGLKELDAAIAELRKKKDARTAELLPDVEIFSRAVRHGIQYRELFKPNDVNGAKKVLAEGKSRAAALLGGQAPWLTQKGLVVRGFRSKIDQTVQPYGLVIPDSYSFEGKSQHRLDLWMHGRGETLSESNFIAGRMQQVGNIAPPDTIVLHPYGRYSNAFKFAGEIDVLEALEHAQKNYRVDENRVAVRGFSMGGAGCWQMAVHYPDLFFAATPGAGFSETPEFLKSFQQETLNPTWYEEKLWRMYDCPGYAINLFQLPTIAYSGEIDRQKQAADVMEAVCAAEGLRLTHLIGPNTAHSIHKDSLAEIESRLASIALAGRAKLPRELHFATYTLRYHRAFWLTVTGLGEHWEQARVDALIVQPEPDRIILRKGELRVQSGSIHVATRNVTGLKIDIPAGLSPFNARESVVAYIDGRRIELGRPFTDGSLRGDFVKIGDRWYAADSEAATSAQAPALVKRHGLQGPIDDAFMDSFIVVRPTGKARHESIGKWAASELDHTVKEWRRQFRGDAIVKADSEISDADIASSNLILFGDPQSNAILAKIADQLPIQWSAESVTVGGKSFDAAHHAPVLIYPNPLNPNRYVILNSGFTYREYAYLNNARQVPKLPDWAVIDTRTPPNPLWPGKVIAADFFNETWQVK